MPGVLLSVRVWYMLRRIGSRNGEAGGLRRAKFNRSAVDAGNHSGMNRFGEGRNIARIADFNFCGIRGLTNRLKSVCNSGSFFLRQ